VNSWGHAKSSANEWGGDPKLYHPIHLKIDSSKRGMGDIRHRAMYHHTEGTFMMEEHFGPYLQVGNRQVPVRDIAERHIREDMGFLPTFEWWMNHMQIDPAMSGTKRRETRNTSAIFGSKSE
jgi:hypothetical protein